MGFYEPMDVASKWRDYSALHLSRGPYVENVLCADAFEFQRNLKKIGKPVDRTEWEMTPPTVNAYYNAHMNEIVFPAGILQPPFFNPDAIDYGPMGIVIGHEMTHGFDDEGSQFDAQGNLKNWWTPQDKVAFDKRAACIVHQFDSYTVLDHLHENGKLVEGESIADLGGLTIAYRALEKSLQGKPRVKMDGLTPGAALLPRLRPDLDYEYAAPNRAARGNDESPSRSTLQSERPTLQFAPICAGVGLQTRPTNGPDCEGTLQNLVKPLSF